MYYIYDDNNNLKSSYEGDYLDRYVLIGLIVNEGQSNSFTIGKVTDEKGNEATLENFIISRRKERDKEFSNTLDKLNYWWKNSLTESQILEISNWRQSWLDYPNNLATSKPVRPTIFPE